MEYCYQHDMMWPVAEQQEGISLLTLLNPQQQHALSNHINIGDHHKRQKVIGQGLALVVSIARHHSNQGVSVFELSRAGIQGLIHAFESFELEEYFHFAAHAARCVRQSIECFIMNQVEPE